MLIKSEGVLPRYPSGQGNVAVCVVVEQAFWRPSGCCVIDDSYVIIFFM